MLERSEKKKATSVIIFFKPEDAMFYEKHKGLRVNLILLLMTLGEDQPTYGELEH